MSTYDKFSDIENSHIFVNLCNFCCFFFVVVFFFISKYMNFKT